jgi:hypothetical protein
MAADAPNVDSSAPVLLRDKVACAVCNWTLRHVASPWYRNMIGGAIIYGLKAAAYDVSLKAETMTPNAEMGGRYVTSLCREGNHEECRDLLNCQCDCHPGWASPIGGSRWTVQGHD